MIIVEGKYDKAALLRVVDATVLETGGFGVFNDPALRGLFRKLAGERGVIVLTDSDGAGFVIRNHLKGILPLDKTKHAYIPDNFGKERRKRTAGKEGKIGVEGMPAEVLLEALRRAGATLEDQARASASKADFYAWGLSGRQDSALRRDALKKSLGLPARLSANALFGVLGALYSADEIREMVVAL